MYNNCCKKCGSTSLHIEEKGNHTGLYCNDCGAWIKWLNKNELAAFQYSQTHQLNNAITASPLTHNYQLDIDKINSLEDCKKILQFLSDICLRSVPQGFEYNGFDNVKQYYH